MFSFIFLWQVYDIVWMCYLDMGERPAHQPHLFFGVVVEMCFSFFFGVTPKPLVILVLPCWKWPTIWMIWSFQFVFQFSRFFLEFSPFLLGCFLRVFHGLPRVFLGFFLRFPSCFHIDPPIPKVCAGWRRAANSGELWSVATPGLSRGSRNPAIR